MVTLTLIIELSMFLCRFIHYTCIIQRILRARRKQLKLQIRRKIQDKIDMQLDRVSIYRIVYVFSINMREYIYASVYTVCMYSICIYIVCYIHCMMFTYIIYILTLHLQATTSEAGWQRRFPSSYAVEYAVDGQWEKRLDTLSGQSFFHRLTDPGKHV